MKTLIFSDTHLDHNFDSKKFNVLKDLILEVDKVIINGDFWDIYLTDWNRFLNSEWNKLFDLLKSKDTTYIFGNHDKPEWMDSRMNYFSNRQDYSINIPLTTKNIIIQHGNKIYPSIEEKFPILIKNKALVGLSYRIYDLCAKNIKGWFSAGYFENRKIQKWIKNNLGYDQLLICGHTHFFEDKREKGFINTGLIRFGYLQYAIIDQEEIKLFNRRY